MEKAMIVRDPEGRPLVATPAEALCLMALEYHEYRFAANLSFSVRKKRAMLAGLEHTLSECNRAAAGSRFSGDPENATSWRQLAEFVQAQRDEMRMWIHLREQRFHDAWDALIVAQARAHRAARWLPEFEPAQHLREHLAEVERAVFPRQKYFSPSLIINEADVECSICAVRGGECDHIAGDVYAGEVASRIINNIEGIREVSIVDNPANKDARALSYGGVDLLTGEEADDAKSVLPSNHAPKRRRKRA